MGLYINHTCDDSLVLKSDVIVDGNFDKNVVHNRINQKIPGVQWLKPAVEELLSYGKTLSEIQMIFGSDFAVPTLMVEDHITTFVIYSGTELENIEGWEKRLSDYYVKNERVESPPGWKGEYLVMNIPPSW